jgi:hypothetical protein
MAFVGDIRTVLVGTATLLLLSLYTLVNCRQELPKQRTGSDEFLFGGVARRHSLAGTIGYAFSITYFGATTIYGYFYRAWFLAVTGTAMVISVGIICLVIRESAILSRPTFMRGNALLSMFAERLGPTNAHHLYGIYVVIYFALLVEELAVSRLMLNTVFRGHPAIMALLLATICAVILAYLKWGGFRAVLIADFEQLKLLFPFVIAIALLSFRNADDGLRLSAFTMRADGNWFTFVSAVLMLVAWIVSSIDFYSRLNFDSVRRDKRSIGQFAAVALTLTTAIFAVGACYGMTLPAAFAHDQTPSGFTEAGVTYAMALGYRSTAIIFFASVFCMIFSTVNTLAAGVFQAARYAGHPWPQFGELHKVMLWAMALSCFLWPDAVSAVGLFICALMIIPLVGILASLATYVRRFLPTDYKFVWPSVGLAASVFVFNYRRFTDYAQMPYLGALVLLSTLACAVTIRLSEAIGRKYGP